MRMRAKKALILLQEGVVLQEHDMSRRGTFRYDADHPIWECEPTHSGWAAIQGIRLSEGEGNFIDCFSAQAAEEFEPHIPGGEMIHSPASFERSTRDFDGSDLYCTPPFRELNPLLRSFRIARSYSLESLQQMGL